MRIVASVLGIGLYIKWVIDFLNKYLDVMVLTSTGIIVLKWDGLLQYHTEIFTREKIEAITHTQNTLWDKLLTKWDLTLTLDHGRVYHFHNIPHPRTNAQIIASTRDRHHYEEEHHADTHDEDYHTGKDSKFDLLVETLGEVIEEYIDKKTPPPERHSYYDEYDLD